MAIEPQAAQCFVLKAEEIPALNYMSRGHPQPVSLAWINRGTNQELRRTTIEMLLRTLFNRTHSPSIARLHQSSGIRIVFSTPEDRARFASLYDNACIELRRRQRSDLTAVFDAPGAAENAFRDLVRAGVKARSISLLWRAGQFMESQFDRPSGHSRLSVAAASAGGGLAGAIVGITLLTIPGLGPIAVGGAIAAQAIGTMGAIGGALGASGGAIARMLTDFDVEDQEIPYFAMRISRGKIFLSVDPADCGCPVGELRAILERHGGHFAPKAE